jgi:hypothetical protein
MPASTATAINVKTPNSISRPLDASMIILPLFLLGFLLARFAAPIFDLLPACTFRAVVGLPCPTCGATRAGLALAQGELAAAFAFNPLFVICIGALTLWSAVCLLKRWKRKSLVEIFFKKAGVDLKQARIVAPQQFRWLLIGAVLLNWLYLILFDQ